MRLLPSSFFQAKDFALFFAAIAFSYSSFACQNEAPLCELAATLDQIDLEGDTHCLTACTESSEQGRFDKDGIANCNGSPFGTNWYLISPSQDKRVLNVEINSTDVERVLVTVYQGDCSSLSSIDCNQGKGRSVNLRNILLESGAAYFVAVSSTDGSQGQFDLCYSFSEDENACNTKPALTIISTSEGSPHTGPYKPGEVVELCYTVSGFENQSCNYLQGIVPFFGEGWSNSSFDSDGQPINVTQYLEAQGNTMFTTANPVCEGDPAGSWIWQEEGNITYNLNSSNPMSYRYGDHISSGWVFLNAFDPSCFEFDDACCINPTDDPNLSYGDDDYPMCGRGITQEWKVCMALTVGTSQDCQNENDCMVGFKTFADGEIGAYRSNSCSRDRMAYLNAAALCCTAPQLQPAVTQFEICPEESLTIDLGLDDTAAGVYWFDEDDILHVEARGSESIIIEPKSAGQYIYEIYATNGCLSQPLIIEVKVVSEIDAIIIQDPPQVCAGDPITLKVEMMDGTTLDDTEILWNDTSGSAVDQITLDSWVDSYSVSLSKNGCRATIDHLVSTFAQSELTLSGSNEICKGENAMLELNLAGTAPWTITLESDDGDSETMTISDPIFTEELFPDETVIYEIVSATDGNGCDANVDASLEILVHDLPEITTAAEVLMYCDQAVELTATNSIPGVVYTYDWLDDSQQIVGSGEAVSISEIGNYIVNVTDTQTGCKTTENITVSVDPQELQIDLAQGNQLELKEGSAILLNVTSNLEISELATITWTGPSGLDCYDCLTPTASPLTDAEYFLEITDIYGCTDQLSIRIRITDKSRKLYIPSVFQPGLRFTIVGETKYSSLMIALWMIRWLVGMALLMDKFSNKGFMSIL